MQVTCSLPRAGWDSGELPVGLPGQLEACWCLGAHARGERVGPGERTMCGAVLSWVPVPVLELPVNVAHGGSLVPAFLSSGVSLHPAHTAPSSVGHQSGL